MMGYLKQTVISGLTNKEHKCLVMRGHWNIDSAITRARESGIVGEINIKHNVCDMSGRGRGGHDGRYIVNSDDSYSKASEWSEYGVEH